MSKLEQMRESVSIDAKIANLVFSGLSLEQVKKLPKWFLENVDNNKQEFKDSLITEVWNEAVKECEGFVEDYGKRMSELHSEMIGNAHEDSKMMLAFDMHSRLIAVKHITEKIKTLLPRADITSDKTTGL